MAIHVAFDSTINRGDDKDELINIRIQATAVIVASYLDYLKVISPIALEPGGIIGTTYTISPSEIDNLINSVQNALLIE